MGFEQAAIKVEREQEFRELKSAIERVFQPETVERFLKQAQALNVRVRDWEKLAAYGVLERVDEVLAKSGKTSQGFYSALSLSDQAQIREFYLSKVEEVDSALRTKYQKLYRYY